MINLEKKLKKKYTWFISGVAGFIGSNLLFELLKYNQTVIGIDNFSNSTMSNLNYIKKITPLYKWKKFKFYKKDINDYEFCKKLISKSDFVIHQAARGSVVKSTVNPIATNKANIDGFLNILWLAKGCGKVKSFVYASSGSVYGDNKNMPKVENKTGKVLSNYGLTKRVNEDYAELFYKLYGFKSIGLRYFNVFGKFQNPNGDYAAVIPKWIKSVINNEKIFIFGDGKTSRDFTPVENVVYANLLAATSNLKSKNYVYNVGSSQRISLNNLINNIYNYFRTKKLKRKIFYKDFRKGDIRHSLANIKLIKKDLNYKSKITFSEALNNTIEWFKFN
tara:strand:- start:2259 stop:3260 length:1002 start_codon:yes stop_codon:yes gene_type:complete